KRDSGDEPGAEKLNGTAHPDAALAMNDRRCDAAGPSKAQERTNRILARHPFPRTAPRKHCAKTEGTHLMRMRLMLTAAVLAMAVPTAAQTVTPEQRSEIERIVHEYIVKNPQ